MKLKEIMSDKDLGSRIASKVSSFKFAARISKVYNQTVLNMGQLITWENIDKIEAQIKKNLECFASLRETQLARTRAGLDSGRRCSSQRTHVIL